ncbi:hypothetical protein GA0070612_3468 [Micromonospora chokoriensis]|uniref:Uncharacterized protein n=1 Tax=Micromonospora chokoriensis TaxID=356851 RepID=A0A1C4XD47_9ACTN|nr:hypothetical protein GA0070612_3468 [Micromonospora chokoriensis]
MVLAALVMILPCKNPAGQIRAYREGVEIYFNASYVDVEELRTDAIRGG